MGRLPVSALCAALVLSGSVYASDAPKLDGDRDKVSYSIGMDIGTHLKKQGVDVNPDTLSRGLADSYRGAKTALSEEEARRVIAEYRQQLAVKQQQARKELAEKNRKEGDAFRAQNASKEGVITLPSGLQYKVLKAGSGKSPRAEDSVTVNVKGALSDGTKIDSVFEGEEWAPGDPVSFEVATAIAGWKEALMMMNEGARWQIVVPPQLAYGDRGDGRGVGPEATLVYELELISIKE
jgi:FKBP-type peptidyl-prolyl cis-trans isomerase FklB